MKYLSYYLFFTFLAITSISCDGSDEEPSCRKLEETIWICDSIQLEKHSPNPPPGVNQTALTSVGFNNVQGKFDNTILANFSRLRQFFIFNSSLDLFDLNSKYLEKLKLYDTSFPVGAKFTNCCAKLENLSIKNNVGLNLHSGAFSEFHKLKKLALTNQHLPTITRNTFKGLRSLKKLSVTNSTTTAIEADAFLELTKLKELYLEDDTMETIDSNVFKPLRRLTSLTIYGENLKPLSLEMFSEQRGLVQLGLPLSTWKVVDVEKMPSMFPKLYAHSYIGKWKNAEEKEYLKGKFFRLSQLLLNRQ